jgi:hypothetical protein
LRRRPNVLRSSTRVTRYSPMSAVNTLEVAVSSHLGDVPEEVKARACRSAKCRAWTFAEKSASARPPVRPKNTQTHGLPLGVANPPNSHPETTPVESLLSRPAPKGKCSCVVLVPRRMDSAAAEFVCHRRGARPGGLAGRCALDVSATSHGRGMRGRWTAVSCAATSQGPDRERAHPSRRRAHPGRAAQSARLTASRGAPA